MYKAPRSVMSPSGGREGGRRTEREAESEGAGVGGDSRRRGREGKQSLLGQSRVLPSVAE